MTQLIGALDIGGTKIAASVADATGFLARMTEATVKSGAPDALARQCIRLLDAAAEKAGVAPALLQRVGVSSCGPFRLHGDGIALVAPNICGGLSARGNLPNDWTELPLQGVLAARFAQVEIRNDCIAALQGERTFGAVIDARDCVYVTWSTGIGFGLCVDGRLLAGKQGNAGHAGHLLMDPAGQTLCGCGSRGDLESLISGMNITRGQALDTPALFAAAKAGDAQARKLVTTAASWLGRALYDLTVTLDTSVFVIGGSVWQHHGAWLAPIVRHELESRFPVLTHGVTIVPPGLDAFVADVGALCLVMPAEWIEPWRASRPWQNLHHLPN